tara:strand:- start:749 stop:1015 length:267 start_codon:yes stop_codon:yes gene_type:complete
MNSFISKIFGFALAILHVLVVCMCLAIAFGMAGVANAIPELETWIGGMGGILTAIIILFLYSIIIGFVTTIVSINEKLNTLIDIVKSK